MIARRRPRSWIASPVDIMRDDAVLGPWFSNGGGTWSGWAAIIKAAFALPMTSTELRFFHQVSGNRAPPRRQVRELWIAAGRSSGKGSIASLLAIHAAAFVNYRGLRPGERPIAICLASDRRQAGIVRKYIAGAFDAAPMLSGLVVRDAGDVLELSTGVDVMVGTNDYRSIRGSTLCLAVLDECAFYRTDADSSSSDIEVYRALKPAFRQLGGMIVGISTPYKRSGLLYTKWTESFGQNDDDCLVIQAPTRLLNPLYPQSDIDKELAADPQAAASEWLAEWRSDLASFVSREVVEACVARDVLEIPPMDRIRYTAWCDPSGGSGADEMVLAVAHKEGETAIIDCLRSRAAPFSPDDVCHEFAEVLKSYRLREVTGDRYAGSWPAERFQAHGVSYQPADRNTSDVYLNALPSLNSKRVQLLDHNKLIGQICNLERRSGQGGRQAISHPLRGHDDFACAALGCVAKLLEKPDPLQIWAKLAGGGGALAPGLERNFAILNGFR